MRIIITDSSNFLLVYNNPKEIMLTKKSNDTFSFVIETECENNVKILLDEKTGKSLMKTLEKINTDTIIIKSVKDIEF